MSSLTDFRRVADDVRNWGRWGDADELGTLNFITSEKVQEAASLVKHGKVFPLGVDFGSSGAQGAFKFRHNPVDVIIMPLQAATQWDALSHVYYEDKLYNGFPASSVTSFGAYHCGIDKVDI